MSDSTLKPELLDEDGDTELYLQPLSRIEVIKVQMPKKGNSLVLRLGYYSRKNEISYDVNKVVNVDMAKNIIEGLQEALDDIEKKKLKNEDDK